MRLHGYFRSSAARRVRIALNLKGLAAEHAVHHLRHGGQRAPEYLRLNPQGLVAAAGTRRDQLGAVGDRGQACGLLAAEVACNALPAFLQAAPDWQPGAE